MIIIDKPYVSEFLIKTIKGNNIQIVATKNAKDLITDDSLNWISEEEAKKIFVNDPNSLIYTNSENSISWLEQNSGLTLLNSQIQYFKNKIKFREILQNDFPDFFFKAVKFDDLDQLNVEELKFPFIIKPSVGFLSLGVHKVDNVSEWPSTLSEIHSEIEKIQTLYPKVVLNVKDFIIEQCIEGEEHAVDCYFDKNGEPVILSILHHVFSSGKDVSDRVYSTSEKIFDKHKDRIQEFLNLIGLRTGLKNFPCHVEIRIDENGKIIPIEINPMRFGGWCTSADLTWYAYGFNSYEYFQNEKRPDWKEVFKSKKDKIYSVVILDNNSGIKESEIESFDYEKLKNSFEKTLDLRKIDVNKQLMFGFVFAETSSNNKEELDRILKSNLREFITVSKNPIHN